MRSQRTLLAGVVGALCMVYVMEVHKTQLRTAQQQIADVRAANGALRQEVAVLLAAVPSDGDAVPPIASALPAPVTTPAAPAAVAPAPAVVASAAPAPAVALLDPATAHWESFKNKKLPPIHQMAYSNPEARVRGDLEDVKAAAIWLGAAAVRVENNKWLTFYRNVPADMTEWEPGPASTLWVVSEFMSGQRPQPDPKYGCSRHHHACVLEPAPGSAPCCATVMKEIMDDMTRVLHQAGIHWRLTQGQMLSVVRDGRIQLWDHDFDPLFEAGKEDQAKELIIKEMHLAGKATKWREADYYYTKRVAERQQTDWSKYTVVGGDFNWDQKEFHDPYALQRNPTFCDIDQASTTKPTKDNTFQCAPGLLCARSWHGEVSSRFHDYKDLPIGLPAGQISYTSGKPLAEFGHSDLVQRKGGAMYTEDLVMRSASERDAKVAEMLALKPNFWDDPFE